MDHNSKKLFNLYKQIINEAAEDKVPFSQPLKMAKTSVSPTNIQKKASELKSKAQDISQQAQEPTISSDDVARQAQPLVAAANKEAGMMANVGGDPTSLIDIPTFGNEELVSWKDTEFPEMNIRTVEEQAEAAYDLKESFLLIGDPGVGKSSIFRQVGKRIAEQKGKEFVEYFDASEDERDRYIQNPEGYFFFVDIRITEMDRSELVGVPVRTDKPYTVYSRPSWAVLLSTPGADGFLFLDEFNQGLPDVKNACFKVVLDRVLGDKRVAPDVGIAAACNMGEIFGNDPITPANINRFGAGVLVVSPEEWREYAVQQGIEEAIIAFTKAMPEDALYKEPNGENPFVTPRQLEKISKGIKYFREKYDEARAQGRTFDAMKNIAAYAAGRAGVPWTTRFVTFLKHIQSFDMGKILKDPKKYLKDQPLDKSLALIVFVSNKIKIALQNSKNSGGNITPEDREIMTGIAKIMNNLSKEAVCVMFEHLNKEVPKEQLGFLLDFLTDEEYDPAVKREFFDDVLPQIRQILSGGSCKTK